MVDNNLKLQKSCNARKNDFQNDKKEVLQLKKQYKDDVKNYIQRLSQLWDKCSQELPADDPSLYNIAVELCSQLLQTKNMSELEQLLKKLPDTCNYSFNEKINRARIFVSMYKGDTKKVYKLIEENHFTDGDDLIKVWDEARYLDEEERTKKQLTPLSRFRVRKRYPPPASICRDGIRKTNTLPREATSYLKYWLMNHLNDPYPSANEKQQLAKMSGLSHAQVKTWFANARRRSKATDDYRLRYQIHFSPTSYHNQSNTFVSPSMSPASYSSLSCLSSETHFPMDDQMTYMANNISCPWYNQAFSNGYSRNERYGISSSCEHFYTYPNSEKSYRNIEQTYIENVDQDAEMRDYSYSEYPPDFYH